jgi:intracellular septation protein
MSHNKKMLLDLGPLVVFLAFYLKFDLIYASGALVVATLIALAIGYSLTKKISYMQLVTAALVVVFGSLTFYFKDPFYLKVKVSIINVLFGSALLAGLWFKKLFLKTMLGEALSLPDSAWHTLTLRWAFFFFGLAILNLLIWFYSEPLWVNFKVFGILGLTALFAVANAPYMAKHMIDEQPEE